jgi:NitT/TauT family transport system substrate-binding protein
MPVFQGALDLERLQRIADLMQRHGITGDRLEVSDLVAEPVR